MEFLTCDLNRESEIPLYDQLYQFIKTEIITGRITYNTKLPSKRKLAEYLGISLNTVETAYEQLISEGYVKSIPRKGYFVQAYEELAMINLGKSEVSHSQKKDQKIKYHFHPSFIDTENFPFDKWRKYTRDAMVPENQEVLLLGDPLGEIEFRSEIANYLYQARGVKCKPENVVIGAGIEILLQQLIQLFHEKTVYGVEDPGYHAISRILKYYSSPVVPLKVDNEGLIVDELKGKEIDVVYVTPSHHFPYGAVLPAYRRIKLLNWTTERKGRYIIEDDYDSEFRYSGKTIPSLQSLDQGEKVIYLGTFSKSLIPSLRISYMVLPDHLMKRFKEKHHFISCTVSKIDQFILTQFMRNGDFERHLNRMRKVYRSKLDKTLQILRPYNEIVQVNETNSGFHIVITIKNGMNESELVEHAKKNHIKVYPLSYYSLKKRVEDSPKIVFGFAGIPEKKLEEAIQLLLRSWGIS